MNIERIFRLCRPSQIYYSIICFGAIYMIYIRFIVVIWNECDGNKTMNRYTMFNIIFIQADNQIFFSMIRT